MAQVFTLGHGTLATDELVSRLTASGVGLLVDVRRFPSSRRSPHLAREALEVALPAAGIQYEWWGEVLGGRRSSAPGSRHGAWRNAAFRGYADHMDGALFRSSLERLEVRAGEAPLALMCAETLWWRCHRRLIADALVMRGHEVLHLMAGSARAHPLHPGVRRDEGGWPVYDRVEAARSGRQKGALAAPGPGVGSAAGPPSASGRSDPARPS